MNNWRQWVSTETQNLDLQIAALTAAGVPKDLTVTEKIRGKAGADRPLYRALLRRLNDGDSLVVWKMDRLGRSTLDALQTARDLDDRGVRIVITTLGVDLKTPGGRMVFDVMVQIAEFERELIHERVTAGVATAKARGVKFGRPNTLTSSQRAKAVELHAAGQTYGEIAALFGCGKSLVARAVWSAKAAPASHSSA